MKKIICGALTAVMLLAALMPFQAGAVMYDSDTGILGDANSDGNITPMDVLVMRKYLADGSYKIDMAAADVNRDGTVTPIDALSMRKLFAGQKDGFYDKTQYKIGSLAIAGTNIGSFGILLPADATENMKFAASELAKHVKAACGAELETVYEAEPGAKYIYISSDEALGKEGVRIKVENGSLYITGGTVRGCMYAVYEFLERYVGWVFVSEGFEYIHENEVVDVPEGLSYEHIPVIADRDSQTWSYSSSHVENALKLKISSIKNRGVIERSAKYGYGEGYIGTAHSIGDYTACTNSQQICYNDDDIFEEVLTNVIAKIEDKKRRGDVTDRISVAPMDNTNYCTCSICRGKGDYEGSPYGYLHQGTYMGPQLYFINKLAAEVEKVHPDTHILTTAYWEARIPPKTIQPRENVDILFCWAGCNGHTYDGSDCCKVCGVNMSGSKTAYYNNKTESGYFEKWRSMTDTVIVWIYATSYAFSLGQPIYTDTIPDTISYLAGNGLFGIYCEGYYGTSDGYKDGNCFDTLTMYLLARCMWDPDMTREEYDAYADEFLMVYYGGGWESLSEYLRIANEATRATEHCWTNNYNWTFDAINREYIAGHAEEIYSLIDAALEADMTAAQRDNLLHLAASAYWQCLCATYDEVTSQGSDAEKAEYQARYERLCSWVNECGMTDLDDKPVGGGNVQAVGNPFSWTKLKSYEEFYNPILIEEIPAQ